MRLVIVTFGTEGDARPLAALGHALVQHGHAVLLTGEARTLDTARALGVPAAALSGDIRQLFATAGAHGGRRIAKAMLALMNTHAAAWLREVQAAAQGCDAVVVSGLASFAGLSVAERLGIPAIGAGMFPLTPTREFPSPLLPPRWMPAWFNRASMAMTNQMLWRGCRQALNHARAEVLGLSPRRALWTEHAMLYGISPTLLPRPADWPANATLCGQWVPPLAGGYSPPPALAEFLAAGDAPIYAGFGSMTGIDMPAMLAAFVKALDGRRVVFWPGWNGIGGVRLPGNVHCIEATPHDWLFPRMAAIVHHGGSGTTHSAARAGKPSIVMPFAGDQPFWAERLYRLGIAPPAVPTAHPDARRLAAAFDFARRGDVIARAAEVGRAMAREDGLATAVARIDELLHSPAAARRAPS